MLLRLLLLICAPLCEPNVVFLTASPSQPIEGTSMTLTCNIQHTRQKSNFQFQFCFFKDGRVLGKGWNSSPDFQIATIWRENSGSYWCGAKTVPFIETWSRRIQIQVQRVPVSNVSLETQPPGGLVMEGEKLVLVCLVAGGTGDITFFWYKGALGLNLETKTQRSLMAKFEIPTVRESDAEQYYCAADNGYGPSLSGLVSITVRIPVSRPVLTLRAPGAEAVVVDVVELHCEAQRGSPPILYKFYHEDVTLGNSLAPSGGGVSFNFSLTAEYSGNYYCEANNGLGAQRSELVPLNITVPTRDRKELLTSGVIEVLLGILGLGTMALLFCCWLKRKIGRRAARDPPRSPPSPVPQQSTYLNSPDPEQQHPVYENVNVVRGDEVYSLVYHMQQELQPAAGPPRTHIEDKDSSAIYSWLKKASITDLDYEDAM
ncbi:Fc receptor-like protein 1 isoform X2 [Equus asinus]|uniref:Fc receptor-like protein 1 isoform X2 n=1 Tax=Equus asinus TaxID=9793 RepID=UPI001D0509D3|nr:Fc receptor-like protein 1 isoform X2 [Equus asinus]